MKKFLIIVVLFLLAVIFVACSSEEPAESQPEEEQNQPMTFEDTAGSEFTLSQPLEEVVVINRNVAEALSVLGVDDRVAATGDTTLENNAYLGYDDRPDVGRTSEVNLEKIISLEPDAVITYTNRPDDALEKALEPAGIPVIRLNHYLPEQMDEEMRLLGTLFDAEERAEEFLEWKQNIEDQLDQRVSDIPKEEKREVMALSVGFLNSEGGYRIFPSETTEGDPGVGEGYATIMAGGKDAADVKWDDSEESTTVLVDEEYVLERNPEVLTLHGTWLGGYDTQSDKEFWEVYENIIENTSVSRLKAFEQKDIFIYHTNFIGSDKRYIGVLQLAKDLYPDRFSDVEPEDYAREYFEDWLGIDYSGTWMFSPKDE
ncbi:ABC transporter substrate-binding protein [Salipaludibacillus sp. CUR1]|uniref:ABC transporter substrate-binding protein n=1 Tax=Salipaludibacillus sp. CUR1 TaxID=2820003 RepID=UPI001E4D9BC2|nr:ABC transporter substrate-binding protein [Salipaludibacillus sp. CUR1]MCE7792188.1 ABC transporter substrate-binding protein [Salipaludibacillus sp. CUR1]